MPASCRFAFAVHILVLLASRPKTGATSEIIAASVNTNPVVIRRLLAALRRAGFIVTRKGAGTGSRLSREPAQIALDGVYRAVEPTASFSLHARRPNRRCPIGREMEDVLGGIFASAQSALERELARCTLADVLAAVQAGPVGNAKRPLRRRTV